MTAIIGGLAAAVIWATGSVGASRAARGLGPVLTLAWVMLIGLVAVAVTLPFSGSAPLSAGALLWLVLGGAGNVGGLLLMYRALRLGRMGVVMPIVTTEGGIAAAIAIAAGQSVSGIEAVALVATVVGVAMTAISRRPRAVADAVQEVLPASGGSHAVGDPSGHGDRAAAGWAAVGALAFGVSLYGTGRAGTLLPAAWAVLPPRVVGVVAVTVPLALGRRLRRPRGCLRWLLLSGIGEVGGFFAYAIAARHGIAVAAVLATLTGAFGTALGWLLFGERLRGTQFVGVGLTFVGVAALSAVSA